MGGVSAAMCGDSVGLVVLRIKLAREDEDEVVTEGGKVAGDEVDGAIDAVGLIELAEGVGIEGVLVAKLLH